MGDLERKLAEIEKAVAKGELLPAVTIRHKADLEGAIARVFNTRPGHEMQRALADLAAARALAKETWERVRASKELSVKAGAAATQFARAGGAAAVQPMPLTTGGGGLQVLFDWVRRLPHTYTTKKGKHCLTDRWISDGFLVFDPGLEPPALGSIDNPWFGINGPKFRCYYPGSSVADWESCMTSGSSGRWLGRWGQRRNYTRF